MHTLLLIYTDAHVYIFVSVEELIQDVIKNYIPLPPQLTQLQGGLGICQLNPLLEVLKELFILRII